MNEISKKKRLKVLKIILLFWTIFIGLGALLGSTCMFIDKTGKIMQMDTLLPYFQVLPLAQYLYQDYIFPGIALLIVNGISNIVATIFILLNKKVGYILGTIFGFTLMLWITIQFVIFPVNFLSTTYFIFGLLQLITGIVSLIFYKQTEFKFNETDYKDITDNSKTLVLYFSRMGYAKKIAYSIANKEKGKIIEIKAKENVKNTLGFWWCGRFGMHKWPMKIEDLKIDLNEFDKIIIVGQIWVFHISSPIRELLNKNKEILNNKKDVSLIVLHFNPSMPKMAKKEIISIIPNCEIKSLCSEIGHINKKSLSKII